MQRFFTDNVNSVAISSFTMVDIALFLGLGLCINNSTCDYNKIFDANLTSNFGVNYDVLFNKELLEGSESIKSTNLAALAKDLAGKTLRVTTLEVNIKS